MDFRALMLRANAREEGNLRYSPEPRLGKMTTSDKLAGKSARIHYRSVSRRRYHGLLPVAAAIALGAFFGLRNSNAESRESGDWIETWTASPQPIWGADFFAPLNIPRSLRYQTVRQIATITLGGTRVRIVLSNEYGSEPLVIGAAHVAVAGQNGAIVAGSDGALTFGGKPSVTIPPGA